jgi:hypothetical protein
MQDNEFQRAFLDHKEKIENLLSRMAFGEAGHSVEKVEKVLTDDHRFLQLMRQDKAKIWTWIGGVAIAALAALSGAVAEKLLGMDHRP